MKRPRIAIVSILASILALAAAQGVAQQRTIELTVDAPSSLAEFADRVRGLDRAPLVNALGRAGLAAPSPIRITLVPESDVFARQVPTWIVGLASGTEDIAIFPARIGASPATYPYDSLQTVVWHEVVHLALAAQAGDRPLPRWFHEGVAMSVEQGWGLSSQAQLLFAAATNPDVADLSRLFDSDAQPEAALGYLLAAALVADVRDRHGQEVPGAIVRRVARGSSFAEAFALETGETPDQAAAHAWQPYRRWTAWLPLLTSSSSVWIGIMALAAVAFVVRLRKRRRRAWEEDEVS